MCYGLQVCYEFGLYNGITATSGALCDIILLVECWLNDLSICRINIPKTQLSIILCTHNQRLYLYNVFAHITRQQTEYAIETRSLYEKRYLHNTHCFIFNLTFFSSCFRGLWNNFPVMRKKQLNFHHDGPFSWTIFFRLYSHNVIWIFWGRSMQRVNYVLKILWNKEKIPWQFVYIFILLIATKIINK